MEFEQLMIADELTISDKQKEFVYTHRQIMYSGNMMTDFAVNLAENLKKMKDEKLYIEAGFESFGQYAEQACGLKERQAYNYIKIIEKFDKDFLHSNAKIGVTKLCLIASLDAEENSQLQQKINIEEISTRELKEQIQSLKQERENQDQQYQTNLSEINDKLKKEQLLKDKLNKKLESLNKEIKDLKNAPAKTIEVENPKVKEELEKARQQIVDIEAELQKVKHENQFKSSEDLVEFKILFDNLQDLVNKIKISLSKLPNEMQEKFKNALKVVGGNLC